MRLVMGIVAALVLISIGAGYEALWGEEAGDDPRALARRASQEPSNTVRITRSGDPDSSNPSAQQYTVECRIVSSGRSRTVRKGNKTVMVTPLSLNVPVVTVRSGEKTTIADTSRRHFVVPSTSENGSTPITREIPLGTVVEVSVVGIGNGRAIVDVTADLQSATADGQSIRVDTEKGRMIACVRLGEPVSTAFDGWTLEAVVDSVR
ncbi:MAG: hypothetical protein WD847_06415 [Pirellulales bacterium]